MAADHEQIGDEVTEGVLRGYFKTGKRFVPPIMALPGAISSDWVKSSLPDLLWPILLVSQFGDRGSVMFAMAQRAVIEAVGTDTLETEGIDLDGRLTSLERASDYRDVVAAAVMAQPEAYELFDPLVLGVMAAYGDALPGAWLFERALELQPGLSIEESLDLLASAVLRVIEDRHLNALAKAAPFGWAMQMGKMRFPSDLPAVDSLVGYPGVPENVDEADAFILSTFLAMNMMVPEQTQRARDDWCRMFWNLNWALTPCIPAEVAAAEDPEDSAETRRGGGQAAPRNVASDPSGASPLAEGAAGENDLEEASPLDVAASMYEEFMEKILARDAQVDLYSPAKFEVLSGLVARAFHSVVGLLRAPHLWTGEQASGVLRSFRESRIHIAWMLKNEEGGSFDRYQDYGLGKRRLYEQVLKGLVPDDEEAPPDLQTLIETIERQTGGDHGAMFQTVSVEATFSGKNLRAMAAEVGLADEYRAVYQRESGVTHAEWWALEDYAMQRCLNPLHRFHWLPTFSAAAAPTRGFPVVLLDAFEELVALAAEGLSRTEGPE
ncbi:MAG: DUF5677 domain-containing protein [Acidimicrobiales bacterium]